MTRSLKRLAALGVVLGLLLALPFACAEKTMPPGRVAERPPQVPIDTTTPREIELSDATMKYRDAEVVLFEVKYRFAKGQPQPGYEYQLEVDFPGTANHGLKPLIGRQVQKESIVKDGFQLSKPGAKSFEMKITEAQSPQHPYHKISNVATGTIQ